MKLPEITRRNTTTARAGAIKMGGDYPVVVQTMTNTPTRDADTTISQIKKLADAGAQLVRVAVPTKEDTVALGKIVAQSPVGIVADVHFHFDRALEAIEAGVVKIRLNPGNIKDRDQVRRVINTASRAGVAIRVGVNEGSIVERGDQKQRQIDMSKPIDQLMVDKMGEYLEIFEAEKFDNLVLSAKSPDAFVNIAVNRKMAQLWNYPLHLGVTHSGTPRSGSIRSAAALGAMLAEGIGDTVRISYSGDPVNEVLAAKELLQSLRLMPRQGVELISCPTCGRLETDINPIIEQIEQALASIKTKTPVKVAVMGCIVNGPGEAQTADIAICAGKGKAILYRKGQPVKTVTADQILNAVINEVQQFIAAMK